MHSHTHIVTHTLTHTRTSSHLHTCTCTHTHTHAHTHTTRTHTHTLKHRSNVKSVFVQAVVFAVAQSFIFYVYSAGYSFGAFLVIEERATYDLIFRFV